MSTLAPPQLKQHRTHPTTAQRIVAKHDELETLIDYHRSRGLPTADLWEAMLQLEDRLQAENPRSYSHWLAIWLTRRPTGAHPTDSKRDASLLGQAHPDPTQDHNGLR